MISYPGRPVDSLSLVHALFRRTPIEQIRQCALRLQRADTASFVGATTTSGANRSFQTGNSRLTDCATLKFVHNFVHARSQLSYCRRSIS